MSESRASIIVPPNRRWDRTELAGDPGLRAYLDAVRPLFPRKLKAVHAALDGRGLWVVTEVRAGGDLNDLDELFAAELKSQAATNAGNGAPLYFELVDLDVAEGTWEAPPLTQVLP